MEQVETVRNTGASITSTTKIYWKNDNLRIEKYAVSGSTIQIKHGRDFYVYVPAQKAAQKVVVSAGQMMSVEQMFKNKMKITEGGKKIGAGLVAGVTCDIYSIPAKGRSSKVYVSTDSRFPIPLKIETTAGSMSEVSDTTSLKLNTSISDSMFTLPKGTKLVTQSPKATKRSPGQQSHKKH